MIEWVWVTDRLPPVETYVLLYMGSTRKPPVMIGKYRPGMSLESKWWAIGIGSVEPTHWAPITFPQAVLMGQLECKDWNSSEESLELA